MAGVALTFTGTDNDEAGGNATGIAASYAMGALTVNAAMSDESDDGEDDTSIGLSYAMDSLTVGYTTIKPGKDGGFGDEWDFSVGYSAGAVAASFALTKQMPQQSSLITHSVAAHLHSQQCTTKLVQTTT